ncbi:hypothetical protein H257_07372 [Aphanomyces astaci]|uniref:Uncharacterized protein n=1 Tax=Aphanomyces astaci TaxID=112090 RepID=W4GHY8_APHAT|nr:hypothetical protein H257_07372 [Aphanomyces astaci]ETV79335.1 hypothetical protein H257_07372 [Aphanomyces astaci]|eukprot:XP_009831176.1 hypothetical protein H257_07372 [Aphanomyces astaci]
MTPFLSEINEDMLRQFEDEFDAQKSKVEQAREMLKHKKSLEIQKQVESMRATVANLDKDVLESRENRKSLRNRLMERKALMKTHMAEHQELRRCTWNVERTHQLEGAAQRRLDLERLQDERKRMESLLDAATIELDAIESEKRRRQETVEVQMKRILDKGTVLKQQLEDGHLDIPEVRRTIQDHGHEQFVQECHGLRRLQQQQRVLDQHKRQKELNVERAKLVADEDILRQQMHLQAADPTGLIGATECDDCVDDVVAQACQILATGDATLSALQNSIVEKTNVVNTNAAAAAIPPAYNGSLGPQSYPPWLEASREMAQSLIMEVVTALPLSMFETMRSLKQQRKQWKCTQRRLGRAHRRLVTATAIQTFHQTLVDDVVDDMLRDLHGEFISVTRRVSLLVTTSIVKTLASFREQTSTSAPQTTQLVSAMQEMQRRRNVEDGKLHTPGRLFPRHILTQSLVEMLPVGDVPTGGTKKKWFGGKGGDTESAKSKPLRQPPTTPPHLKISRQVLIDAIARVNALPDLVALEASCWKHVLFQPVANLVMPITAVCVHFCRVQNEFVLCAGGAKGELALVDVGTSTVLRQRLDPPQPGRTASIQSFGSQFLVYAPFQLKLWTSRPVKGMALSVVFNLTKADLALPGRELQDVTTGCFVPAASLSGTSSSIVVGTADGSILRLNRSTDDVRPVFGASSLESPNPNPLNNSRQEHFQFHRAAIVFLACVGTTPSSLTILSVDVTGIVCHWTNANWTGFGWFEPAQSLQLVGPGVVQSAQLTTDSSRLVVFTFDAATRQGVFIQLTWQPLLAAMSTVIRIGCMSPPPPFTILPPLAALSRTACDSVLVMGSTLAMYSLGTGQVLTPASASSMECKSQAVSVTCSDGYVVGCGANGKIMAFQMQDLSSIDAVHAARRLAQPFNHQTQRQSRTIVRVQHAGDRNMVRAMVVSILDRILVERWQPPPQETVVSPWMSA